MTNAQLTEKVLSGASACSLQHHFTWFCSANAIPQCQNGKGVSSSSSASQVQNGTGSQLHKTPVTFVKAGQAAKKGRRMKSQGLGTGGRWDMNVEMGGMSLDQDWALCDKDCGWCGHCADGVI